MALTGKALAQGSVDAYTLAPSTGTFAPISAAAAAVPALLVDDAVGSPITIFPFNFDGTTYTQVVPSSNCFLSFNTGATTTYLNDLTNGPSVNRPLAALLWDDMDGRTTGSSARYNTTGAVGSRVFTFQWLNWGHYEAPTNTTPTISMQVKLYEGTNVVQYIYRQDAGAYNDGTASIGLSGVGAGVNSFLSLGDTGPAPATNSNVETATIGTRPATGQIYTFTPPVLTGCPAPRSILLTDVTATGATLNFRGNGNASNYTIVVTPQGGAARPAITATTSPVILTGLTANTGYTVTLVSNCAAGATSSTATLSFATIGPYCMGVGANPLGGICGGNDISAVSLTGTTLNVTNLTCNTTGGSAYTNYAATGSATATLSGGVPYQLNVNTSGPGTSNAIISAWLDANQDLRFTANEWVQVATNVPVNQVSTVTLYVPAGAVQGRTGLRIRTRFANNPNGAGDACTQFFSGDTKDFTVTIGPPAACPTVFDATLDAITPTTATLNFTPTGTASTYTVTVTPQGGAALPTITAATSPISLTSLTPNKNYTVRVVSNCGAAGTSIGATLSLLTPPAPPVNDNCAGAINVPVTAACTAPLTGTVLAASQSVAPTANCGTATTAFDVWYSFVATGINQNIAITGQFAGVAEIRSGSCAASSSIFCSTFAAGSAGLANTIGGLTTGQTYLVRIYPNGAAPGLTASDLTICVTPGPVPPANNNCAGATPLPITAACSSPVSGTVAGASQSVAPTAGCGFGITTANDVWYSFVASGPSQQLTFAPQFNGVVDVRSGTCASSASVYCNTSVGGSQLTAAVTGLTTGSTYFVRVYASTAANPAGAGADFTLCLVAGSASPPNDNCAGAIDVPVSLNCTSPTVGTNVGASASMGTPAPTCVPNGYAGGDIWFKLTVPTNGTVTVSTVQPPGVTSPVTDTQLAIYSGTCGALTELGCNDEGPQVGYSQLTINGRTAGETLYVRVYSYGNTTSGPIAVCATTPNAGPCAAPSGVTVANIGATTATLAFTPSSSATTYTISYVRQGSTTPVVLTATGSPVSLTGLTAGSAYTVSITSNCAGGINSSTAKATFATITPCAAPTNAAVSNVTATTARLGFGAASGAVSYFITLTPAAGAPTSFTASASPVDLTGLVPGTAYTVSLSTNCGGRNSPVISTAFTTLASYCDTGLGGVCGTNDIRAVAIAGTTLNATGLTCTTAAAQAYTLYSATGSTTTELVRGTTYPLSVTTAAASIVAVWIDYNHNLTYEASEFTQVALATTANAAASVNITPATGAGVYYGPTSMRIRSRAAGALNGPTDACTNFSTGETKDFVVTLVQFPACPAVSGLALSNISTTTATLSFTPAAGAASYSVVATPATGPALPAQTVTGSPANLTGLAAGTTYSVSITTTCTTGRASTPVAIALTTLAPCPAVTALTVSNITTTGATLNFTPAPGAASYAVVLTPTGGMALPAQAATGSPVSLTGLSAGTTYSVRVTTTCASGVVSPPATTTLTVATPCPAATTLVVSNIGTATATLTFAPAAGAASYALVLTPTGGTALPAQTVTGSPASLTGLTPGTTYGVSLVTTCASGLVSPAATATLTTATPCPAPTGLAFSAVTATTASLGFTAAAGAVSYTLTLTPAAGPAQTVTGSPISLTGLVPNTAYQASLVANCGNGNLSPAATSPLTTLLSSRSALDATALLVYPNPSNTGQLTLQLGPLATQGTASLLNVLGQTMLSSSLNGHREQVLNVRHLATGVYTLRVRVANGQTLIRKVVLE